MNSNFIMQYVFHGMDLFSLSGDEVSLQLLKLLQFCSFSLYRGFMQRHFSLGHSSPSILGNCEMIKELVLYREIGQDEITDSSV